MVYIITAIFCEAAPIIKKFNMKKVTAIKQFQVFKNEDIILEVSGVGAVKAVAATTFILTYYKATKEDILINIGVCGARDDEYEKENSDCSVFLCSKIIDSSSKQEYYPDLVFSSPFEEAVLETYPRIVDKRDRGNLQGDIIDMEGAFVYGAASIFLYQHNIHIIKVVSDGLEPSSVSAQYIEDIISGNLEVIHQWINSRKGLFQAKREVLSEEEQQKLAVIRDKLKLSETMKIELQKLAVNYKLRRQQIDKELDDYMKVQCSTKKEGKKYFDEIRKRLMEL